MNLIGCKTTCTRNITDEPCYTDMISKLLQTTKNLIANPLPQLLHISL